jgi:hypothetical protein
MAKSSIQEIPVGCYVYEIIVDGVVRYIGKGRGNRMHKHAVAARRLIRLRESGEKVRARKFLNKLAKSMRSGSSIDIRVVCDNMSDESAFAMEMEKISALGRSQLWNSTEGGEGNTSEYAKQLWADPEFRERHKISHRRATSSPEFSKKSSELGRIRWSDPSARKRMSDVQKARYLADKDHAFRRLTPEIIEKNRAHRKKEWADESYRAKQMASRNKRWENPEQRAKTSASMSIVWSDIDRRERMAEKIREKWRDPKYREAMMASRAAKRSISC